MRRTVLFVLLVSSLSTWVMGDGLAAAVESPHSGRIGAASVIAGGRSPASTCSIPLKLFDGTNQGGSSVSISQRLVWVNLSAHSFDNKTSSYTVGSCAVDLASGANGGGQPYTRCLSAGCVENVMDLGWDNTISSVYLH
jgi:hypothetical protein